MSFVNLEENHPVLDLIEGKRIIWIYATWPPSRRLRWPLARNRSPIGEVVSDMTMLMSKVTEVRE